MIIFLWFIFRLLLIITALFLIVYLLRNKEALHTIVGGIREGLKGCGFNMGKTRYSVELYKWVTMDDNKVCEDCLERSSWPPMDIADWMKEGLPQTPEAHTECGENCRCQLVLHESKLLKKHDNKL